MVIGYRRGMESDGIEGVCYFSINKCILQSEESKALNFKTYEEKTQTTAVGVLPRDETDEE